jgi:hypothetical protein
MARHRLTVVESRAKQGDEGGSEMQQKITPSLWFDTEAEEAEGVPAA